MCKVHEQDEAGHISLGYGFTVIKIPMTDEYANAFRAEMAYWDDRRSREFEEEIFSPATPQ